MGDECGWAGDYGATGCATQDYKKKIASQAAEEEEACNIIENLDPSEICSYETQRVKQHDHHTELEVEGLQSLSRVSCISAALIWMGLRVMAYTGMYFIK